MTVRVLVGDALSVLRSRPAESVQICVTSPPYYSLRAYGTDPQVWGGDQECRHAFAVEAVPSEIGKGNWAQGVNGRGEEQPGGTAAKREPIRTVRERGFCTHCPAWRGELGSEPDPQSFISHLVSIFDEVWRVLRPDGLCFVNLGDSYSGSGKGPTGHNGIGDQGERQGFVNSRSTRPNRGLTGGKATVDVSLGGAYGGGVPAKNLLLVPQRFAIAMQERGWIVRSEIVWAKTSAMPESVRDRPTSAWEPIWMFSKQAKYFYDGDAVRQPHQDMAGPPSRFGNTGVLGGNQGTGPRGAENRASENGRGSYALKPGGRVYHPAGANLRNVWTLGPEPSREDHYAAFVSEIPRRCILAGTSERGACPACGAPWVRISKPTAEYQAVLERGRVDPSWKGERRREAAHIGNAFGDKPTSATAAYQTLGWQASCSCPPADPVPCVVLDPFLGSGTTALVADRLGRDAIGIELNTEYAEMARRRIEQDAGTLFGDPVELEAAAQLDLFGEVS